jgi:hypothetical protein
MSWTDTSLCETGFGFDRKNSTGRPQTFAADYMVNSEDVCFSDHAPTSVYDDLVVAPSVTVGSVQTYCVRAINEVGYDTGYRSDSACKDITIAWEASVSCLWVHVLLFGLLTLVNLAQIEGVVRGSDIAGKLPTKDAVITWELLGRRAVRGSTTTDADGHFTIDIQVW